jgi:uncharacterized protein YndB with AHSA1/START domain
MTNANTYTEPKPELRRRDIPAGEARVAVMKRTYDATVEDVWSACTDPERLARWYVPVTGDLRVGGTFEQKNMGSGEILACDAPSHLRLSLGGGADEIEVWLRDAGDGLTELEVQHATTISEHEIGGQMYDAILCMGGGYYPRLYALDLHLRGVLPEDWDAAAFHLVDELRPNIDRGMADMQALLDADAQG